MRLKDVHRLELPPTADMHVHLRQDQVMNLVVPHIRRGGVDTVFVMPNLQPPVTSVAAALEYKASLQAIEPRVNYLMSLYLHPSVTPDVIAEAARAGIAGVKLYPQGVTTNSESGVAGDFVETYTPTFAAMEQHDIVLNLHGEVPGTVPQDDISLEELFLPTLKRLNEKFPKLRIVLEHCSTAAAVDAVRSCSSTVAGDVSEVDPHAFCKPIPKTPSDRDALLKAVCSGDPKFFFGSDSAPHPLIAKQGKPVPAGVFTQPYATQLVLLALEEASEKGIIDEKDVTQENIEGFLSLFGRRFYKLAEPSPTGPRIVVKRTGETIPASIRSADGALEVGISRSEATISIMAHMTNPLATVDQLYKRTSSFGALPSDLQDAIFFSTQSLTQSAGLLLRLPQSVTAQASVVLARYWLEESLLAHEFSASFPDVSAASLFLVAKLSSNPCRPRDVCNVYTYLLSTASPLFQTQPSSPPDASTYYLSETGLDVFQKRILRLEARILYTLNFDTHVALPHGLAVTYLQALDFCGDSSRAKITRRVIAYLNTALLSPQMLYLTHQPNALAVSAIYSAARDGEISAKMPECPWWEVFDVDREELGFLVVGMRSLEGLVRKLHEDFEGFAKGGVITKNSIEVEMARRGLKMKNGTGDGAGEVDEEEAMMRSLDDRAERMEV
ncbi:hypothetical protein E0Z10_g6959 [Xylaria hypoxylon]|uniref:dihydroorotase n=1 Tax=Xylaria hypoxylon TaxID=37992 RepID=A0A4Z0YRI9_9PEZI|nr:hypothetical protein E0Z10_g6959 [Xylaria hypoxylon]